MDYEKLHKDTINKLQQMVNSGKITVETARGICADFVPESEDERIRKRIIQALHGDVLEMSEIKEAVAWLEKQGKNCPILSNSLYFGKPALSEEDEKLINSVIELIDNGALDRDEKDYFIGKLNSLKDRVLPKQEWSEEDEKIRSSIIDLIRYELNHSAYIGTAGVNSARQIEWLKSLRPQNTWKPSDEQMHYLSWIANIKLGDSVVEQEVSKHLNELLEELKKLREE